MNKRLLIGIVVGIIIATLTFTAVRLLGQHPEYTHYHANWAVYIDGNRLDLSGPEYMEAVNACIEGTHIQPNQRVHMHEGNQNVVHVHHEGVTWGHLVVNLLPRVSDERLIASLKDLPLERSGNRRLSFILNGQSVSSIVNRNIESEDRLLIDYSDSDEATLTERYENIPTTAGEFNHLPDPASCSGSVSETWQTRLRRALLY